MNQISVTLKTYLIFISERSVYNVIRQLVFATKPKFNKVVNNKLNNATPGIKSHYAKLVQFRKSCNLFEQSNWVSNISKFGSQLQCSSPKLNFKFSWDIELHKTITYFTNTLSFDFPRIASVHIRYIELLTFKHYIQFFCT